MATEFIMPKLGLTMEEGTILEWLVADGERVESGTPVLRIETDKVESDVESSGAGVFHRAAEVGDTFPCGRVIGWLLAEGETPPANVAGTSSTSSSVPATTTTRADAGVVAPTTTTATTTTALSSSNTGRRFVSPNAKRVGRELGIDPFTIVGTGPGGRVTSEDVEVAARSPRPMPSDAVATSVTSEFVVATAAARQLADLLGVDLALVPVDPTDGRVTRDGVAAWVRQRLSAPPAVVASSVAATSLAPATQTPTTIKKMTGMRGTIAKRMHASLHEMAQLTLTMDADMDAVVADRERRAADGDAPGYTDYVIAAVARALAAHPLVNSQVVDDGIAVLPDVHVGMAVALDGGLVVPVVRHADCRPLSEIAAETKRLAAAARDGQLSLGDLEGGTFSVSALGMFGVDAFTPVINPPNTAILGVGRLRDDVVLVPAAKGSKSAGPKIGSTRRLTLSLTWDHRVFDGAPAAQFCRTVVELLADPAGF